MKLKICTPVNQSAKEVWEGFNADLFLKLAPPFPKVKLLKFEGRMEGNEVEIELNFIFFRQTWLSLIEENGENEEEIYFVDVGMKLPFFLKRWKHRHIIRKKVNGSEIIDDIEFSGGNLLMDLILLPGLFLQFLYRKPVYKKVFQ